MNEYDRRHPSHLTHAPRFVYPTPTGTGGRRRENPFFPKEWLRGRRQAAVQAAAKAMGRLGGATSGASPWPRSPCSGWRWGRRPSWAPSTTGGRCVACLGAEGDACPCPGGRSVLGGGKGGQKEAVSQQGVYV